MKSKPERSQMRYQVFDVTRFDGPPTSFKSLKVKSRGGPGMMDQFSEILPGT